MIDPYSLLGRQPIPIVPDGSYVKGKRVLVTGAGGSIGSELCGLLASFRPAELIMLDRDESALHALQLGMTGRALLDDDSTVLGDIRDKLWINKIMITRKPDIVFHAAALKHLPMLQRYPGEAYKTNVLGTRNVLRAAVAARVDVLVNISTDKAADPTCVLGSSKRVAERLVSWHAPRRYMSVRFGNVLNSRGSVLETFRGQMAMGIPLTVTDPEVCRYFMTSHEAVSLVVHAGAIGRPGRALVMDMGEPVRIVDIAKRLIDMDGGMGKIVYTGMRDGEKVCEDMLGFGEVDSRPEHPLIRQVDVPPLQSSRLRAMNIADSGSPEMEDLLLALCDC